MRTMALITLLGLVAVGCDEAREPSGPQPAADTPTLSEGQNGFTVLNIQLRAASADVSSAWGHVQLRIGNRHPPDPCGPEDIQGEEAAMGICGIIHNPAEETLLGGQVIVAEADVSVPISLEYPPSPCREFHLEGGVVLTPEEATALRAPGADVVVGINNSVSADFAAISGSSLLNPGPPDQDPEPGAPSCTVTVARVVEG